MNGSAVLLLHGYATNVEDYFSLLPHLNMYYDYVEIKNYPGHDSGSKHLYGFNAIDTIKQVVFECEYLFKNYEEVDVIGFSMGGAIATYLATNYNFRKVILLAPANKFLNIRFGFRRLQIWFDYMKQRLNKDLEETKSALIEAERKSFVANDKKSLNMAVKQLLPNYTPETIAQFMEVVEYCNSYFENGRIYSQTLLLWGDVDQLVPKKTLAYISERCEHITTKILPGISHLMLNSENNEIIVNEIINFIKK